MASIVTMQITPHSHISGYTTVDVVETEDENDDGSPRWIVLELGDGGSCDPAPDQDMCAHWQQLWGSFGELHEC